MEKKKTTTTTILTEHRKVSASRHLLSVLNFIAILLGTIVTLMFVNKRGAPVSIKVHLYILIVINVIQIAICIVDFVFKHIVGIHLKFLHIVSYSVGGVWLATLISEMIFGSQEFGVLRIDLLGVAIIQILVALIAYIAWPSMDRRAINKMILPSVRGDHEKRKKKSNGAVLLYLLLSVVIVMAQVGSLLVYKVPPRLYDLFAESRAVQYEYLEEEEGYLVSKMYSGTSTYVNIPSEYNGKPVIGIKAGALVDDGVIDSYKITKLVLGTQKTNDEGEIVLESNLRYIESGAIVSDKITELELPESIVSLGESAIKSSSLKKVTYSSIVDFDIKYLECSALETVIMTGDNVGRIKSLDGMSESTTIQVDKDIYNSYRQENSQYVHSFRPILAIGEHCVDFYTDCDYYIDSIFFKAGEEVELRYSDLKNTAVNGASLAVDTLAYIQNSRELGTDGAKKNSAFRGWYYDGSFSSECQFTESGSIRIAESTSLYAKWVDEYSATLNWSTYQPVGETTKIYWTNDDVITLPVIEDRKGYDAGIYWYTQDTNEQVLNTQTLSRSVDLRGEWILNKPVVDISSSFIGSGSLEEQNNGDFLEFTYDESNKLTIKTEKSHDLDNFTINDKKLDYSYKWSTSSSSQDLKLQKVADSGTYTVTVTAISPYGETSSASSTVEVKINKKQLDIGSVTLADADVTYSGAVQRLYYEGTPNSTNVKVTYNYYDANGELLQVDSGVVSAGVYTVKAVLSKNNAQEAANYETATIEATLNVLPKQLVFDSWVGVGSDWVDDSVVYNGQQRTYKMIVSGILPGETAELEYYAEENRVNTATNAGSYTAEVVGVKNTNYTLSAISEANLSKSWSIEKKQVKVEKWQTNGSDWNGNTVEYDGTEKNVKAILQGAVNGEETLVKFTYATGGYTNSATAVNKYTATVLGVDNDNYYFDSEDPGDGGASKEWEIVKRNLQVEITSANVTYNGELKGITATVKNFVASELGDFEQSFRDVFDFQGTSNDVEIELIDVNTTLSRMTFSFYAKNAATYDVKINGLTTTNSELANNYALTAISGGFTINPKALTVRKPDGANYVYNAAEQELLVNIEGIVEGDLENFDIDYLDTTAVDGRVNGSVYQIIYKFTNAGEYSVGVNALNGSNTYIKNYVLNSAYSDVISINKKTLTIDKWTIENKEENYETWELLVYNKSEYKAIPVVSGVEGSDEVVLTLTGDIKVDAGSYTTEATLDTTYNNYVLSLANSSLSWNVIPYSVDFNWVIDGNSAIDVIYSATEHVVEPKYEKLFGDDTITISYVDSAQLNKTNAGSYTVRVNSLGNSNYQKGAGSTFEWTISPKQVNVSWGEVGTLTYNGQYQGPTFSLDGLIESDVESGSLYFRSESSYEKYKDGYYTTTYDSFNVNSSNVYSFIDAELAVDAGEYSIYKFSFTDSSGYVNYNYTVADTKKEFVINQKELTLSGVWSYSNNTRGTGVYGDDSKFVYNANYYTLTTEIASGIQSRLGTQDSISLVYSGNQSYNAGEFDAEVISLSGSYSANYKLPQENLSCEWEILRKHIDLTWTNDSKTFNRGTQYRRASVTKGASADDDDKVYDLDSVTLYYTGDSAYNAGTYLAEVTGISDSNYYLDENSNSTCEWSIARMPVDVTWDTASLIYNGQKQHPKAYYKNGSTVYTEVEGYTVGNNVLAGDGYTVTALDFVDKNYVIASGATHTYSILQREVALEWSVDNSTYLTFTYDGIEREVIPTITNKVAGDSVELTYNNNKFKNAGSYTVTVTNVSNDNYKLSSNPSTVVTVNKRLVTFNWAGNTEVTYDGQPHALTATAQNVVSGDTVNVNYTNGINSYTDANSYTIYVESITNDNYTFDSYSAKKSLRINKQKVKVTWSGEESVVYDGNSHTLTATVVGANDNENVSFEYYNTNSGHTYKGSYTIKVYSLNNSNYTLDDVSDISKTLTINPRPVKISWTGLEGTYNPTAYLYATPTVTNAVGTDAFTYSYYTSVKESYGNTSVYSSTANYVQKAGVYTVMLTSVGNSNYTLTDAENISADVTIAPQKVAIAWDNAGEYEYSGYNQKPTVSITGVTSGETVSATYYMYKDGVSISGAQYVGSYECVVASLSTSNYTLDDAQGSLSVEFEIIPKQVQISWSTNTYTYDGYSKTLTATISNKYSYDYPTLTYSAERVSDYGYISSTANYATDAGVYRITVTGISNSNYTLGGQEFTETLTINPRTVYSISWSGSSTYTYDGYSHKYTASVHDSSNNYITGYHMNIVDANGNEVSSAVNAGTYTFTVVLDDTNYTLEGSSATASKILTINPKAVSANWNITSDTIAYTGEEYIPQVTVSGAVSGQKVNVEYTIQYQAEGSSETVTVNEIKEKGTYILTATALDNPNYTLSSSSYVGFIVE